MKKVKNYVKYAGIAALVAALLGTPHSSYARAKSGEHARYTSKDAESEYTKVLEKAYKIDEAEKLKSDYAKLFGMLSDRTAPVFVGREVIPSTSTADASIWKLESLFLYGTETEELLATFRMKGITGPVPFLEVTAKLEESAKNDAGQKKKVESLCDLIRKTVEENKK